MKMVSYWTNTKDVYDDDGLVLIIGYYNHKNKSKKKKALGVHWGTYPQSHNVLSPCVIPEKTRIAMLSGLLQQAAINKDKKQINDLTKAIKFFI